MRRPDTGGSEWVSSWRRFVPGDCGVLSLDVSDKRTLHFGTDVAVSRTANFARSMPPLLPHLVE